MTIKQLQLYFFIIFLFTLGIGQLLPLNSPAFFVPLIPLVGICIIAIHQTRKQ